MTTPSAPAIRTPPIDGEPIRLAVCVSGGGTSLQNLIDRIAAGKLDARIVQVIASRPGIGAIARAEAAGIPVAVAGPRKGSPAEFTASVFDPIRAAGAELVLLAGFLAMVHIPEDFQGRVINIHPTLIPSFCGKGFYGLHAHQAVLDYGAKVSGCTVHFADDTYDTGPIILQRAVPVLETDDAAALAARVFEQEREALPEAVALFAAGRLKIEGRRVIIAPEK